MTWDWWMRLALSLLSTWVFAIAWWDRRRSRQMYHEAEVVLQEAAEARVTAIAVLDHAATHLGEVHQRQDAVPCELH